MGQDLKFEDLVPKRGTKSGLYFKNYESSSLF